ncbi:hypothetical protein CPB84DRAFT_1776979 [Gymnopilus junonius]|uniref:Rhodopsin domain-containing protein n=1 Tax=Gymnopilus junonius TaxID=109634 RepID=A0A9P5TNP8_GYMJU|nr:hypothetical protein CPB84DRAFT_1776979 [Gymnopilus junonius]
MLKISQVAANALHGHGSLWDSQMSVTFTRRQYPSTPGSTATLPLQSYTAWKVSLSILHAVAIVSTLYRLVHRFRIRRSWWDDYVAFLPLMLDPMYWMLTLVRFYHRVLDLTHTTRTFRVLNSFWLSLLPYLLIVWSTRVALSLSLGRIFPAKHPARRWSYVLVGAMIVFCITNILVANLTCKYTSPLLVLFEVTHCDTGAGGFLVQTIFLFVVNVFGDLLLVISPLIFFWRIKLPAGERRLILMVFSGSILTLLAGVVIAIIFLNKDVFPGVDYLLILEGLCNIEASVSLFVCNLTVVSTRFYQAIRRLRNLRQDQSPSSLDTADPEPTTQYQPHSPTCTRLSDKTSSSEPITLTEISSFPSSMHSPGEEWTGPMYSEKSDIGA